jgi:hypothetical protein
MPTVRRGYVKKLENEECEANVLDPEKFRYNFFNSGTIKKGIYNIWRNTSTKGGEIMELDKNYAITVHPITGGQYQAYVQKKTPVDGGTSLGEPLFFSQKYSTEEQAYQEAKGYYDDKLAQ